jgi:DNA polymerase-3 subunit beta
MKKLIISTDLLKRALKKLSQAVPAKPVIPALSNLFIRTSKKENQAELITTDLELTISYVCSCECSEDFEALIPFDLLSKLINLMGHEPIEIQLHPKNKGTIVGGNDVLQLGTLDKVEDYPKIPDIPKKNTLELDENFMTWLDRSMASIGKDDSRPAMTRALLELEKTGITIVSTDAHTLFRHFFPGSYDYTEQILISPKIAKALQGFEKTILTWHAKHVAMKAGDITVISTRHNEKYPDYKIVIPNHERNLEVNRAELISGLNRVSLINSGTVDMFFPSTGNTGKFTLTAEDDAVDRNSEASIAGIYTGDATQISFSPELLKKILHQIPFDVIWLHIDAPTRAALITAEEDPDYLGMIMPLSK